MSLLWALVLLRLAIPMSSPSVLSLQNLFVDKPASKSAPPTIETWMSQPRDQKLSPGQTTEAYYDRDGKLVSETHTGERGVEPSYESSSDLAFWLAIGLQVAWPCGTVLILASNLFTNWRFSRRVGFAPVCHDSRVLSLWARSSALAGVRREIPIVLFDGVQQPALMGVFNPRLLLPPDVLQLSDQQLKMIMLHELAHVRRRDVAINWLLLALKAVQWINPIFWLAASRFSNLREQACDAFALRRLGGEAAVDYGELLVTLAARATPSRRWRVFVPASMLSIFSSAVRRRAIAARLRALPRAAIARKRWQAIAIGAATLLLAYCGLTDADVQQPTNAKPEPGLAFAVPFERTDMLESVSKQNSEPLVTRDYDIAKLVATVAGEKLSKDAARTDIELMLKSDFKPELKTPSGPELKAPSGKVVARNPDVGGHVVVEGDRLHLTTTAARHLEFEQRLRAWEQSGLGQVSVEMRFITKADKLDFEASVPWRYIAPSAPDSLAEQLIKRSTATEQFRATAQLEEFVPVIYAVLDADATAKLVESAQGSTRTNIMQAPKVTLFNGQVACVADYSERPFVVAVEESPPGVVQPKIAIGMEGTRIQLQTVVTEDRKAIQLSSRIEFNGIDTVQTARYKSSIATDHVVIQVPRMRRYRIDLSCDIPANHSLIVRSLNAKPGEDMYLLLTPRIVADGLVYESQPSRTKESGEINQ
jgi:beta-lactamase regulating signal transducer with metallopeptidase domain